MANTVADAPQVADVQEVLCRALQQSAEPLTVSKLRSQLTKPYQLPPEKLNGLLNQLVSEGSAFRFAPYGSKAPRFWSRGPDAYARQEICRELEKAPLSIGVLQQKLARRLADCPAAQRKSILDSLMREGQIRQLPPVPGGRTQKYSARPPDPADYVRGHVSTFVRRIVQQAGKLDAADVPAAATWRAALELLEQSLAKEGVQLGHVPAPHPAEQRASTAMPASDAAVPSREQNSQLVLERLVEFFHRRTEDGPVSIRELRQDCWPDAAAKPAVDAALLALARSGRLTLFRHDYPASLSDHERHYLVADDSGNFYNAILLRKKDDE